MRASVDVGDLTELAHAVSAVEGRLSEGTAALVAALGATPVRGSAASAVVLAARTRQGALESVSALRSLVVLAAESYAATEARVSHLVASCSARALRDLLARADPGALERLLVASPMLAQVVAAGQGDEQAIVDDLRRTLLLSPAAAARAQARLFGAIDAQSRRRFALLHPWLVTSMAAAPTSDRFAASRVLVAADLGALLQRRARLEPGRSRTLLDARIALRHRLLDEPVTLRHPDGTTTRRPHQLLSFDPAGDGRIVEVIGDVDRADHLAVFVPGTGSSLDRYTHSFDRMTPFAAADPSLAVVLWQNSDHPDEPFADPPTPPPPSDLASVPGLVQQYTREHIVAAAFRDSADLAGPVLAADVAGLRAAVPRAGADVTVLGHSYGGSIVGSAEAHGLVADRIVHIASAGAYVDDVGDYAVPATRRFSMTAYDDPIRLTKGHDGSDVTPRLRAMLPTQLDPIAPVAAGVAALVAGGDQVGHGLDPDLVPGVVRLDTGVHDDGSLVRGHSGMFEPGSTAWRNLLAVMSKGEVSVLQPQLWSSHLEPLGAAVTLPGGAVMGGTTMRPLPPRYVVDHAPYDDPTYRSPVLDLS